MDKGLTLPKWVLIIQPKIPQMSQHLSAQEVLDFNEKRLHWASVVRVRHNKKQKQYSILNNLQFGREGFIKIFQ